MRQEISHLVKLVKRYHSHWKNKSYKEVENAILWYALHGGLIHTHGSKGEALLLARRLSDISERISCDTFAPNGGILWVELFYQDYYGAALDLINLSIQRWDGEIQRLAFHKRIDPDNSYRIFDRKFVLRYVQNLERQLAPHGRINT